jgi:hypothetical protein
MGFCGSFGGYISYIGLAAYALIGGVRKELITFSLL